MPSSVVSSRETRLLIPMSPSATKSVVPFLAHAVSAMLPNCSGRMPGQYKRVLEY